MEQEELKMLIEYLQDKSIFYEKKLKKMTFVTDINEYIITKANFEEINLIYRFSNKFQSNENFIRKYEKALQERRDFCELQTMGKYTPNEMRLEYLTRGKVIQNLQKLKNK